MLRQPSSRLTILVSVGERNQISLEGGCFLTVEDKQAEMGGRAVGRVSLHGQSVCSRAPMEIFARQRGSRGGWCGFFFARACCNLRSGRTSENAWQQTRRDRRGNRSLAAAAVVDETYRLLLAWSRLSRRIRRRIHTLYFSCAPWVEWIETECVRGIGFLSVSECVRRRYSREWDELLARRRWRRRVLYVRDTTRFIFLRKREREGETSSRSWSECPN